MAKYRNIKSTAILIGYDADGKCVYSDILELTDYYDREHVWDSAKSTKRLRLARMKGYLFDSNGILEQEFESHIDAGTGMHMSGWARFADGTVHSDP